MFRVVPKDESEFYEKVKSHVMQFARDEGIAWFAVSDSKEISKGISILFSRLWYIKRNVKPDRTDTMNTKKEREKWEKDIAQAEKEGKIIGKRKKEK